MDTVTMGSPEPGARWPEHLPWVPYGWCAGSARYDQTVTFYRDIIGLPMLEIFYDSYGLDGTILGLPGGAVHLEIVRLGELRSSRHLGLISLCSTCPMPAPGSGSPRGWLRQASIRWCRSTTGRPTAALRTGTQTGER